MKGDPNVGRNRPSLKNLHHDSEPERAMSKDPPDPPIEPEEAADAQSRQRQIGKELRRWYDDIVKESVPPDLLRLLKKIDDRDNDDRDKN
jgi:hypothetical protein